MGVLCATAEKNALVKRTAVKLKAVPTVSGCLIMTNRKSPTSFPMSLRWTSYVAPNPQRGPQKRFFSIFRIKKLGFSLRKSATKFLCVKTFSVVSCKAFSGLSIRLQMVGGGRPLQPEILGQSDPPPSKTATCNRYSPVLCVTKRVCVKDRLIESANLTNNLR